VACLTVSILAGFVPSLLKNTEVEARDGDFVQTVNVPLHGSLKCEVNSQSRPTGIEMIVGDTGSRGIGTITFEPDPPTRAETKWEAESLQLTGSTQALIRASLLSVDKFVRSCIGSTDPELTMVEDIHDDCHSFNIPSATFKVEVRAGSVLQLTGTFNGHVDCFISGPASPPPPNSGGCITGNDKNDNLIGTSQNDCIDGKGGNDKISGLAGNDKLNGGDGNDLLSGGAGNDELTGGNGADKFDCGAGKDKITDFNPSEGDIKSTNCE
jgi:hypothetical protein